MNDIVATITSPFGIESIEVYYGNWTAEQVQAAERRFMRAGDTLTLELVPAS